MSAKLIKIRTIIDFFLLNSNLSRELLIKRINKLIKIHNTQVKQGRFHEDAMEYIRTAEQLIFLKNTKKRVYEFFEGTEYEDIIKARYRERGNYNYIAYELHMSQGKYYYMMNKVYSFFAKELYKVGLIKCQNGEDGMSVIRMFFSRLKEIIFKEDGHIKSYSKFDIRVQENFLFIKIQECIIQFVF